MARCDHSGLDLIDWVVRRGGRKRHNQQRQARKEGEKKSLHVVESIGKPFSNSGTSLDNFKGLLISSALHMASTKPDPRPTAVALGNLSFGFGWWYYAQTEGATALA
jgi:hypothetical protein